MHVSNPDARARCSMPDLDVTFASMGLSLLRRFVKLAIPWATAVVANTARLKDGWLSQVDADWTWVRTYGDPQLPEFQDNDGVRFYLSVFTKTMFAALLDNKEENSASAAHSGRSGHTWQVSG